MSKRNTPVAPKYDTATYAFATHTAAWAFMRDCDAANVMAGFPSLDGMNTVAVAIDTWMTRDRVDAMAGSLPVAYAFAGQVAA